MFISWVCWGCCTKIPETGEEISNEHVCLTVLEAESLRSWHCRFGVWSAFLVHSPHSPSWFTVAEGSRKLCGGLCDKHTEPTQEGHLHILTTFQRLHLLRPSHWALVFQHMNFRGSHSDHSSYVNFNIKNIRLKKKKKEYPIKGYVGSLCTIFTTFLYVAN